MSFFHDLIENDDGLSVEGLEPCYPNQIQKVDGFKDISDNRHAKALGYDRQNCLPDCEKTEYDVTITSGHMGYQAMIDFMKTANLTPTFQIEYGYIRMTWPPPVFDYIMSL